MGQFFRYVGLTKDDDANKPVAMRTDENTCNLHSELRTGADVTQQDYN